MALNVDIRSENKGSNPGGRCLISDNGDKFNAYFKFCYGSKLRSASSFVSQNQPVYEAITFELVRQMGLATTDEYVILNEKRDVNFDNWKEHGFKHNPQGRRFYFASVIDEVPLVRLDETEAALLVGMESVFLDSLMISDVVGRSHNYLADADPDNKGIRYLDLGCSFVLASEGFLKDPPRRKSLDKKTRKNLSKRLNGKKVYTNGQRTVELAQLVEGISEMSVPTLNPRGRREIGEMISGDEIREIQDYMLSSLSRALPKFKEAGLLV